MVRTETKYYWSFLTQNLVLTTKTRKIRKNTVVLDKVRAKPKRSDLQQEFKK